MKKIVLKKNRMNHYWFNETKLYSEQVSLVVDFLIESYDGIALRKWINDKTSEGWAKELVVLEKVNNKLVFSYSEIMSNDKDKFEFTVSRAQFLKILDQWEQARLDNLEYIVIEISQNNDVIIYGTDSLAAN